MLDKLIESKSHRKENKKRGSYLLISSMLVVGLLLSAGLWNLFAEDLGLGTEEFELSTVVAPIPISESKPVLVEKEPKREMSQITKSQVITRQTNMLRVDESQPAPDRISVVPNSQKSRPVGNFLISDTTTGDGIQNYPARGNERDENSTGVGISNNQGEKTVTIEKTIPPPPPPMKKSTIETVEKRKTIVSDGMINGKATSLPKPSYPLAAKAVNASGNVNVQVTIDETGRVISAKAIDGHPLLRPAAEKAAWSAKFEPTLLSKQPVKVTGVIVYRFAL